jgi:hypothetical protein
MSCESYEFMCASFFTIVSLSHLLIDLKEVTISWLEIVLVLQKTS